MYLVNSTFLKKIHKTGVPAIGAILLVILLINTSISDIISTFFNSNITFVSLSIILGLSSTILKAKRYAVIFPPGKRFLELYSCFALIRALILTVPFKAGELVALSLLKSRKFTPTITKAAPAWIFFRVSDVFCLIFITCISWIILPDGMQFLEIIDFRVGPIIVIIAMIIGLTLYKCRAILFRFSKNDWFAEKIDSFTKGLTLLRSENKIYQSLFWSLTIWVSLIGSTSAAQLAFGSQVDPVNCIFISTIVFFIGFLPIHAPLGIGTEDAAWTSIMLLSGMDQRTAINIAINIRILIIIFVLIDWSIFNIINYFTLKSK